MSQHPPVPLTVKIQAPRMSSALAGAVRIVSALQPASDRKDYKCCYSSPKARKSVCFGDTSDRLTSELRAEGGVGAVPSCPPPKGGGPSAPRSTRRCFNGGF